MTTLERSGQPLDYHVDGLRSRVAELETVLRERGAEMDRLKADLVSFKLRYRQDVGLLHEELEELERAIVEAEAGERSRQAEPDCDRAPASASGTRTEPPPRYTSDAVRRLFRDVAKIIHPDLASDDAARDRRHGLMIEANRAYALGDEERLRWILKAWERSPEAVPGRDAEAMRVRLLRRIAQLEEHLDLYASDLAAMQDSPVWKLKAMVDEASARGKNLVRDTVRRLERDIMVARNRLEAIRSQP